MKLSEGGGVEAEAWIYANITKYVGIFLRTQKLLETLLQR